MADNVNHRIKTAIRSFTRFWSEDRSLTAFLILLIVEIFIIRPYCMTTPSRT